MKNNVIIIGGGAAGIICALRLRQLSKDLDILILEKQNRIGKKILVTGSGKCNLSNKFVSKEQYNHQEFMDNVLSEFSYDDCETFFKDLGILFRVDDVGRAYPYSESAKAFLDLLLHHLDQGNIKIITSEEVIGVSKIKDVYQVKTKDNIYQATYVVFATGGQASVNFINNSYKILEELNHTICSIRPGLVPLKVRENTKSLNGIRTKAKASLLQKEKVIYSSEGEIQFRDEGLSGILSLELSSYYNRLTNKEDVAVSLDLMSDYTVDSLKIFFKDKLNKGFSKDELLTGLFNKMLAYEIVKKVNDRTGDFINNLVKEIKDYRFTITSTYPFNNAQVTLGGASISEITNNFESKLNTNLYIIGEVLDIDGNTGGYNLHFSWLSGIICANNIYIKSNYN